MHFVLIFLGRGDAILLYTKRLVWKAYVFSSEGRRVTASRDFWSWRSEIMFTVMDLGIVHWGTKAAITWVDDVCQDIPTGFALVPLYEKASWGCRATLRGPAMWSPNTLPQNKQLMEQFCVCVCVFYYKDGKQGVSLKWNLRGKFFWGKVNSKLLCAFWVFGTERIWSIIFFFILMEVFFF